MLKLRGGCTKLHACSDYQMHQKLLGPNGCKTNKYKQVSGRSLIYSTSYRPASSPLISILRSKQSVWAAPLPCPGLNFSTWCHHDGLQSVNDVYWVRHDSGHSRYTTRAHPSHPRTPQVLLGYTSKCDESFVSEAPQISTLSGLVRSWRWWSCLRESQ